MVAHNLNELLAMDVASRLELISKLWDSIVAHQDQLPITEQEWKLLDERMRADDANPSAAIPWAVVREQLLKP